MKQRIITGLIAFSVFVLIAFVGKWALLGTILCMNALCLYEYLRTLSKEEDTIDVIFFILLGSGLIIAGVFSEYYMFDVLIGGILLIFIKNILRGNHDTERTIYSVWGFIYISLFLALAAGILFHMNGFYILIVTILACIACDTFAYLFGIRFGKHKLAPGISPKKSVEGSIAGFLAAVILTTAAGLIYRHMIGTDISLYVFVFGGVLVGIIEQFGDLSASMIKRKFGVKDYGNALPGHGGFLDRIDGILFAFAAMYLYLSIFL